jgi:hypothetical protein
LATYKAPPPLLAAGGKGRGNSNTEWLFQGNIDITIGKCPTKNYSHRFLEFPAKKYKIDKLQEKW